MKNKEVIEKILAYHPVMENYEGCDGYKYGNPEDECKGIASVLVATVDVIRKAAEAGCNLIITHEPTFYSTPDYAEWRGGFPNKIYEEKVKLLEKYGITVWRNHDHIHKHQPDGIFDGVIRCLGWENYLIKEENPAPLIYNFEIPEMTVKEMKTFLEEKISLNGMRYMGNPEGKIRKVAIAGHLFPGAFGYEFDDGKTYVEYATELIKIMENGVDAIIPGEVIDWTLLSYVRDALQLGKNKSIFNIGHFSLEELGMKYAAEWMKELVQGEIPVQYIPSGDIYQFD